jgi:hypothetical protein
VNCLTRERDTQSYKNFRAKRRNNKTIIIIFDFLSSLTASRKKGNWSAKPQHVERSISDGIEAV